MQIPPFTSHRARSEKIRAACWITRAHLHFLPSFPSSFFFSPFTYNLNELVFLVRDSESRFRQATLPSDLLAFLSSSKSRVTRDSSNTIESNAFYRGNKPKESF